MVLPYMDISFQCLEHGSKPEQLTLDMLGFCGKCFNFLVWLFLQNIKVDVSGVIGNIVV